MTSKDAGTVPRIKHAEAMQIAAIENAKFDAVLRDLRPEDWTKPTDCTRWDVRALAAHVVEVYCACPLPIALRRYAERSASRHSVHSDAQRVVSAEAWARWARPAGIGELVTMDTSAPVDVAELAVGVRARLGASWRASCG